MAQLSPNEVEIVLSHLVGEALERFRQSYHSTCDKLGVANSLESVKQVVSSKDGRSLARRLIIAFLGHDVAQELPSRASNATLSDDLAAIYPQVRSVAFNIDWIVPLCTLVIDKASDEAIWTAVFDLIAQTKPTDRPITPSPSRPKFTSSIKDTPFSYNSGTIQNTSEAVADVRNVLRWELNSSLELDHPEFITTFLAENAQVEDAATAVFDKCREGDDPLYKTGDGWRGWEGHNESGVQRSMEEYVSTFTKFLEEADIKPPSQRCFVASPNAPIPGSVKRKPDLCVANFPEENNSTPAKVKQQIASWREVLVAFELRSAGRDRLESTWLDMVKYAREIFRHQDSRRFVLGLTLCGSTMRLWEFDRLGATTSQPFDIHENGLMFVTILLGFLWMDDKHLGFDPDLMEVDGQRFVKIDRDGKEERLIITKTLRDHAPCIAGRATTCWKVYREGDKSKKPLVAKDSWQYVDRPEEGELVRKATVAGVTNISPYYHHETIRFNGRDDVVLSNVRKGMSAKGSSNPFTEQASIPPETTGVARLRRASHSPELVRARCAPSTSASQGSQKSLKRSSQIKALQPPRKRSRSIMTAKGKEDRLSRDRVRRRIITARVGKSLLQASCPAAILTGILGGLKGHESSLNKANILHRDISTGNILLDEDESDGFLNDFDLAVDITRLEASGAPGKTGTKVFMAIGVLLDEPHSFMHDLESFFWVLFWICIHYTGPGKEGEPKKEFEKWNYNPAEEVAKLKFALVSPKFFEAELGQYTTDYCRPMIPLITKLWEEVFPHGQSYDYEDRTLYGRMKAVLEKHECQLHSINLYAHVILLLELRGTNRFKYLDGLNLLPATPPQHPSMQGTKPFLAIGALRGDPHSFMHDLESFFWVLFWICTHYTRPGKEAQDISDFKNWNHESTEMVADLKKGLVVDEGDFDKRISTSFTTYCQVLIPCIKELRKIVFPGGRRWVTEDDGLYLRMEGVLKKARDSL